MISGGISYQGVAIGRRFAPYIGALISNCVFDKNHGKYGGAVGVLSTCVRIRVEHTIFTKNRAFKGMY